MMHQVGRPMVITDGLNNGLRYRTWVTQYVIFCGFSRRPGGALSGPIPRRGIAK